MDTELAEQYLIWLYARIGSVNQSRGTRTYWSLFSYLHEREFAWLISNDENRVEDGRDLRLEFLDEVGLHSMNAEWLGAGNCSVLELLMGLANRLAFATDRTTQHWFWELMTNLNLSAYNDRSFDERQVEDITHTLMFRTYRPDGSGGLFPMQNAGQDQRQIEIWYQMNLYIQDRHH